MTFPLTPQGVKDQLTALYALSNSALEVEANSIKANFRSWIDNHFTLNNAQKTYLNRMPNISVQYYGDQCWFCFLHRLPITLVYPAPPSPTGLGKWTEGKSSTKLITNDNGGDEGSGQLEFTMIYRETDG